MGPDIEINGYYLLLTLSLVLLNGFFVAAEFAMVRVRGSQVEIKVKTGSPVAKVAQGILHNLDGYLAATQLGITIASLGLGWVGQDVVTKLMLNLFVSFGVVIRSTLIINTSHIVAFAFITILHIVFGELAPQINRHAKIRTYSNGCLTTAPVLFCDFQACNMDVKWFSKFLF